MRKLLKQKRLDAVIFYNLDIENLDGNYFYAAGTAALGIIIIPANGEKKHLVPDMEKGRVKGKTYRLSIDNLKKYTQKYKKIGADLNELSVTSYRKLKRFSQAKIVNISDEMQELRSIKSEDEIRKIRKACRITDDILHKTVKRFGEFTKESHISAFMINEMLKMGCKPSFDPVVASGKAASVAHHEFSNKIRKGFMIIDFGVRYKGYCSDMTRTFYVGKPGRKEIELYQHVLEVQKECIRLSSERTTKELQDFAKEQLGTRFNHAIGHGIGINVHESVGGKLRPGTVFTIEPGYYIPEKLGIRIEDDVLMTKKGPQLLTRFPKNLLLLDQ